MYVDNSIVSNETIVIGARNPMYGDNPMSQGKDYHTAYIVVDGVMPVHGGTAI